MEPGGANWPRKVVGGAPGGFPPALAGARRRALPQLRGLGARNTRAPLAPAGAQSGLPCASSSAPGCSPGDDLAGEPAQGSRLGALTLHTPSQRRQTGLGWGGGILRPVSAADWELAGKGSVAEASGLRAAQGTQGQSGSLPVSGIRQGSPRGSSPSAFPPGYFAVPAGFLTPGGHQGAGRGLSPGRCELSSARPGLSGRVAAARCARWAVRLKQTLGSPGSHHPWAPAPPRWGSQVELPVHSGAPSAVGLTGPASALPCCRDPAAAAAAAAGAVPQRRTAAGAGSLASSARLVARPGCRSPPG